MPPIITSTSTLRDLMGNAPLTQSAQATMSVADSIQNTPHQGARLMGLACAFLLAAEESGIHVPDLIGMAKNCMNSAEGRKPEFKAVANYIREEILTTHN